MKNPIKLAIAVAAFSFALVSCDKSEVITPQDSEMIQKTKGEHTDENEEGAGG